MLENEQKLNAGFQFHCHYAFIFEPVPVQFEKSSNLKNFVVHHKK